MQSYVKGIRSFIHGGVFLLATLPFVVAISSLYTPYVTSKAFFLRLIIDCLLGATAILWWIDPSERPRKSPVLLAYAAFLGVLLLANLFGEDAHRSFWGDYCRMDGFLTQLHFFGFFLVAPLVLNSEKRWERFFLFSIVCSFAMAIVALFQIELFKCTHSPRVSGFTGQPNYLAQYLLIHIFLTGFIFQRMQKRWIKLLLLTGLFLLLTALYYTSSRGTQVGLLIGLGVFALFYIRTHVKTVLCAMCAFFFCTTLLLLFRNSQIVQNLQPFSRLLIFTNPAEDPSAGSRLTMWRVAWKAFLDHPILGWGQENFHLAFTRHYIPEMARYEPWFDRAHNIYLDWLVFAGILGLFAYLTLCYVMARAFVQSSLSKLEKRLFLGLLVGISAHQFFLFQDLTGYFFFFVLLSFAHFLTMRPVSLDLPLALEPESKGEKERGFPFRSVWIPTIVSGTACCCSVWFWSVSPFLSCRNVRLACETVNSEPERSLQLFESELLSKNNFGSYETKLELVEAILHSRQNPNINEATKLAFTQFACNQLQAALITNQIDLRLAFAGGVLLSETGHYDFALPFWQKAVSLCPSKHLALCYLAITHLNLGDTKSGMECAKRAYLLSPNNFDCAKACIMAAIYSKDLELAESLMMRFFNTTTPPQEYIGMAYYNNGYSEKALHIFQKLNQLQPHCLLYLTNLSKIEADCGKTQDAIAHAQEAMRLDPNLEKEGSEFIQKLTCSLEEK